MEMRYATFYKLLFRPYLFLIINKTIGYKIVKSLVRKRVKRTLFKTILNII